MGNEILVDNPDEIPVRESARLQPGHELVSWVIGKVDPWRDFRNRLPEVKRWAEYWRLWRMYWSQEDKNRKSERSRLIMPALSTAIEMSVAEVDEFLSREVWFDVTDDIQDQEKLDATLMRDQLREDMDLVDTKGVMSEAVTNAAIFGTGILKINMDIINEKETFRNAQGRLEARESKRVVVTPESLRPDQCIPDPAGITVNEMLGFGIDYRNKPVHTILEKIESGVYREDALPFVQGITNPRSGDEADHAEAVTVNDSDTDAMHLVEYHGKVPLFLLEKAVGPDDLVGDLLRRDFKARDDEGPLVEAIITIGNNSVLLRATANPFVKVDRSVIMFPWEKVPGKAWGRGVAEKGYNPQKAIDAEMRARVDALGFISAPMLGMDAGRIPRGFRPEVKPGKVWLTQGPPGEVLQTVDIGQLDPNTFTHTNELTQMVQMGTGAFDTSTTLRGSTQSGGNAANSGSMLLGAFVKRSKRAIGRLERNMIIPLIETMLLRYLQFAPSRYPFEDTKLVVKGSLGIIAREIEQLNLTQLIAMLPEEAVGAKLAAAQGFVDLTSVVNKAQVMQALQQDQENLARQQQQQAESQQRLADIEEKIRSLEMEEQELKNNVLIAQARELLARAEVQERKADDGDVRTAIEAGKLNVQVEELNQFDRQNDIAARRLDLQEKQLALKARQNAA